MNAPRFISRLYEFRTRQDAPPPRKGSSPMVEWGMERWQPPKRPSLWIAVAIVVWLGLLFLLLGP